LTIPFKLKQNEAMRKASVSLLIFSALLIFPSNVIAQDKPDIEAKREALDQRLLEKQQLREQKLQQIREDIAEKQATRAARLQEVRKARIIMATNKTTQDFLPIKENLNFIPLFPLSMTLKKSLNGRFPRISITARFTGPLSLEENPRMY